MYQLKVYDPCNPLHVLPTSQLIPDRSFLIRPFSSPVLTIDLQKSSKFEANPFACEPIFDIVPAHILPEAMHQLGHVFFEH